jgi:hypothetical protein
MRSDIVVLVTAGTLGCLFFGWAIVLLTSSRQERGVKRERWRSF